MNRAQLKAAWATKVLAKIRDHVSRTVPDHRPGWGPELRAKLGFVDMEGLSGSEAASYAMRDAQAVGDHMALDAASALYVAERLNETDLDDLARRYRDHRLGADAVNGGGWAALDDDLKKPWRNGVMEAIEGAKDILCILGDPDRERRPTVRTTIHGEYQISSEGRTVWVNHVQCVARFCPESAEYVPPNEPPTMTPCSVDPLAEWIEFKAIIARLFGIEVGDEHRPTWVQLPC